MRTSPWVLVGALLVYVTVSACEASSGKDTTTSSTSSAAAEADSVQFHRSAVLESPRVRAEVSELESYYRTRLGRYFNGGILVAKDGVVIFERYKGLADYRNKTPIDRYTTFQLASTSKPFTGMAVLYLQQKGLLNINDPVSKYIAHFPYEGVTIKTLLDHRSGLPNYLYFAPKYWKARGTLMSNSDVVRMLVQYHPAPEWKPDTHFSYCNTNFALLAYIVEHITGMSFGSYLKQTFFEPLGMNHTYVFNPRLNRASDHPDQSISYIRGWRPSAMEIFDGVVGDKNVYSTPEDLLKWDQALYTHKLFTAATLKEAFTPYSNEHPGIKNYGLGWRLLVYPDKPKVVYHNGWWHGNNSVFYRFIDDSTTLIIFSNRYNNMVYHVQPLWKILHEATFEDPGDGEE